MEDGAVVGRIFFLDAVGPQGRPWMWASGHSAATVKRAAHGYEATREAAMAAFAKSRRCSAKATTSGWLGVHHLMSAIIHASGTITRPK
jgi:hypothetical protein